ncbi:uncharacterized protein LOC128963180 [Oppia nitens]|uniref:uncharacterized protein LOC128963180 n=1 Tax=Oppia nitens TaxID=1686743 RepID=UPI0023DA9C0B|nr:uncharacterized protein LOC128963180 [Oppia nitens]
MSTCFCGSTDHRTAYCHISRKALDEHIGDYPYGYCPQTVSYVKVDDLFKLSVADSSNIELKLYKVSDDGTESQVTTNTINLEDNERHQQSQRISRLVIKPSSVKVWVLLDSSISEQNASSFRTCINYSQPFNINIYPPKTSTIGLFKKYLTNYYFYGYKDFKLYLRKKSETQGQRLRDDMPISKAWLYGQFTNSLILVSRLTINDIQFQLKPKFKLLSERFTEQSLTMRECFDKQNKIISDGLITANNYSDNNFDIINANMTKLSETIEKCLTDQTKAITDALLTTTGGGIGHKYLKDVYVDSETDTQCCDQSVNSQFDDIVDNNSSDKTSVSQLIPSNDKLNDIDVNDFNDCFLNQMKSVLNHKDRKIDQLMKMKAKIQEKDDIINQLTKDIKQMLNINNYAKSDDNLFTDI